jgi:hypothetical protein
MPSKVVKSSVWSELSGSLKHVNDGIQIQTWTRQKKIVHGYLPDAGVPKIFKVAMIQSIKGHWTPKET